MKTINALLLALTGLLPAAEQDWTAWQWVAPFEVNQAGMMRLEVAPAVLEVSRPDLGDLRVLSPAGLETPYLVEVPRHREGSARAALGFKVVLAGTNTVIEISAETAEAVELVSPAREFLKSVSIEGRNAAGEWQPLATNEVIFRQASGAERLRVPLPVGVWDSLRLTIHDDRTPPVPFTGVRLPVAAERPASVELPVVLGTREEVPGETRITLDLGARNLNVAELRFEIPVAVFSRTCNLAFAIPTTDGGSRMESLSSGSLYRVVGEGGVSAEQSVIPVHRRIPARYLVATFRNGDSPPLTIKGAAVRCYPTTLTFHASQAGVYQLLTGSRGASPPDYDLDSLRRTMAAVGGQLLTPVPLQAKADFKIPPALPGVEAAGASIDLAGWTRRRAVDAATSGVIQIELDAWAMAGCQPGLGDLRLIQNGRQIPYLIKPDRVTRDLTPSMTPLPPDPKHPTVSRWEIALPVEGLPAHELTARSAAPLFARRFEAYIERRDELGNSWSETIGAADWAKSQGRDTPLSIHLREQRLPMKIQLQTDHGDNPSIPVENPRLRYVAPVILAKLTADAPLFLVYGNPNATAPQYDLRLVQKELMAAEPQPASLRAEEVLGPADKREKISLDAGSPWLWLALGGVVAALLVVVAKLLPRPATE
ncbi:MAG: DUF3999 family protein [Verrucomicrobiota bacterium]